MAVSRSGLKWEAQVTSFLGGGAHVIAREVEGGTGARGEVR